MSISAADLDQYQTHGYLVVENLYTPEECEELSERARDVVEGRLPLQGMDRVWIETAAEEQGLVTATNRWSYLFKIGHHMHQHDPIFGAFAAHPRLAEVLVALLGPDVKCVQSMFIDKPRDLGVGQPYHQDAHYIKTDPDTLTAAWVALDDADVENGCLHVVPGSQDDPVHPHETPINPAQRSVYLEVPGARTRPEVAVPLKRGSGVFFPGHLLHRSGNNHTSRRRRSYVLHYADARSRWLRKDDPNHPFLLVAGREYPEGL
jgi:phytanoyl-CoA hydroxylase